MGAMTDLDDIYSNRILELGRRYSGVNERLASADATATAHSKLCGSTVTVDLSMQDGLVVDYGQTVKACLVRTGRSVRGRQEIIGTDRQDSQRSPDKSAPC